MKRISLTTAACALAAWAFSGAFIAIAADTDTDAAHPEAQLTTDTVPEVGTRMPDGTIYAGLSMVTGKPSFIAAAGGRMPDGTIYAGVSPDTNQDMYTTPADAPGIYTWAEAVRYCRKLSLSGHHDWRVPSIGELAVQFANRAEIGGFNETGRLKNASGYYWSSLQVGDDAAWGQLFSDGFHEDFSKTQRSSLRCAR